MSKVSPDSMQKAREVNLERGMRLSRIVGRVFPIPTLLGLLAIMVFERPQPSQLLWLVVGLVLAVTMLLFGAWLAKKRVAEWSARFVVVGTQLAATVFQVYWASTHGVDVVVVALFIAQTIPLGLSSALVGAELLRNIVPITVAIITLLYIGSIWWFHPALPGGLAVAAWLLTLFFTLTITGLLYGGGIYYDQALAELGSIKIAYERAQQLDALKDQFITHVNHELRTPIMTMQGIIEYLQAARTTMPPEQEEQLFAQASRNGDRLMDMLTSILDVRKIEREDTVQELAVIGLPEAVRTAQQMVDPLQERPFVVDMPPTSTVWADGQLLQQILVNLFSNAIKYSPKGSQIEVGVRSQPIKGTPLMAQITVRDHGPGIHAAQADLLFRRFVRLPQDLASAVPGSGVGLYLCKVLTEAMGGKIWVEPVEQTHEGAVFCLELPTIESVMPVTAPLSASRRRTRLRR
jgi:signal transduction histidine kinase